MQASKSVLSSYQNFASTVSSLSSSLSALKVQTDQQISSTVGSANGLIQKIFSLNQQIQTATASGDTSGGLLDQRDQAVQQLSQYMDVRTSEQSDGRLTVATGDGVTLVGDSYAQLSYSGGGSGADSSGNLVSRIDVDLDAGTMSVDGGAAISYGGDVGSFASALNGALGSNGTASFQDGKLSIAAGGGNGIVVQDDATTPSSRAGSVFSQFFGLNDILKSSPPSILATGLSASDAGGFAAGGTMSFALKGPNGQIGKQFSVTLSAGMSIGDIVNALNTQSGGAASFSLGSDGSLKMTPSASYSGYQLNVAQDTTTRGSTGVGFTQLFGLGTQQMAAQAQGFSVNPALTSNPQQLAFGQPSITSTTAVGDSVIGSGDSRGLLALQDLATSQRSFSAVGSLGAQITTLGGYAAGFYQNVATQSQTASGNATEQGDRLQEAQSRQSDVSGINLDEELSNMNDLPAGRTAPARAFCRLFNRCTTR